MELGSLPVELLREVLDGPHRSYLVVYLWKTGDRNLHRKLMSAVTHIHLRTAIIPGRHFDIPRLLSNFGSLRHLSLESGDRFFEDRMDCKPFFSSLPQSLETLRLKARELDYIFHNYKPGYDSSSPQYIKTDYGRSLSTWYDVGALFPRLSRLEIVGSVVFYGTDLAGLPSTLRVLKVPEVHLPDGFNLECLPRTLERLEAKTHFRLINLYWESAPPDLVFIGATTRSARLHLNGLIPPQVKIGSCNVFHLDWTDTECLLPANLDSLHIEASDTNSLQLRLPDWLAAVPRSLTSLRFSVPSLTPIDASAFISQLPPHLTHLHVETFYFLGVRLNTALRQGEDISALWPKTLQTLSLIGLDSETDLNLLPKTLTVLELCFSSMRSLTIELHADALPKSLFSLSFGVLPQTPAVIVRLNVTDTLPASLTRFGNVSPRAFRVEPLNASRDTVEKYLPSTLTDLALSLPSAPLPHETAWALPSQLTRLKVSKWRARWLESLPRQITSLTISELHGLADSFGRSRLDLFASLPIGLTSLTIGQLPTVANENFFAVDSISSLTHLRLLNCPLQLHVPSSILPLLPKSLRTLKLALNPYLRKHAPSLPPWLRSCEFYIAEIDFSGLSNMGSPHVKISSLPLDQVAQCDDAFSMPLVPKSNPRTGKK